MVDSECSSRVSGTNGSGHFGHRYADERAQVTSFESPRLGPNDDDDALVASHQRACRMLVFDYYLVFIHFFGFSINPNDYSEPAEKSQGGSAKSKFVRFARGHITDITAANVDPRKESAAQRRLRCRRHRLSVIVETVMRTMNLKGRSQLVGAD